MRGMEHMDPAFRAHVIEDIATSVADDWLWCRTASAKYRRMAEVARHDGGDALAVVFDGIAERLEAVCSAIADVSRDEE